MLTLDLLPGPRPATADNNRAAPCAVRLMHMALTEYDESCEGRVACLFAVTLCWTTPATHGGGAAATSCAHCQVGADVVKFLA